MLESNKSLILIKYPLDFPLESLSALQIPSLAPQDGDSLGGVDGYEFISGPSSDAQQIVNLHSEGENREFKLGKPFELCVTVLKTVQVPEIQDSNPAIAEQQQPLKRKSQSSSKKSSKKSKK
jgi:hypothetical protein